ncbi:hypothetical protein [Lyngbya confervoides]|uniref:MFS transporter permease n=1 Tax=Lyngbya confervoides BDU141951 TaxID=1574623 RepID=A0ABD4T8M0_9CYAN|nr:hypothetical protein [Lyngbya confervoides]MCM1984996.1 hypothetical protein [Lyngbya confervoides BDU141951]
MITFSLTFATALMFSGLLVTGLTLLPRLGAAGKTILQFCTYAPGLDALLACLIWIPWVVSGMGVGWVGLLATVAAQVVTMQAWIVIHELIHRPAAQGPRIVGFLNQRYGWWRNNLALWVTSVVLPVFFLIRFAELLLYPCLVVLLDFRRYDHREWVSVSRQKFEGLVGHDLIWCLYCDWMTGVYSLGAEMLRNVESFWCPIRFYDGKKCENCQLDFPDIAQGWVGTDGSMADVVKVLEDNTPRDQPWRWLSHPDRSSRASSGSEKG